MLPEVPYDRLNERSLPAQIPCKFSNRQAICNVIGIVRLWNYVQFIPFEHKRVLGTYTHARAVKVNDLTRSRKLTLSVTKSPYWGMFETSMYHEPHKYGSMQCYCKLLNRKPSVDTAVFNIVWHCPFFAQKPQTPLLSSLYRGKSICLPVYNSKATWSIQLSSST